MPELLDMHPHAKKMSLDTNLIHFRKINSEWITDLNVKHKTIKPLEDNKGECLDSLGYGDDFLVTRPKYEPWKKY